MSVSRNTVADALVTLLRGATIGGVPVFKTVSRRLKLWGDVPAEQQPACFVTKAAESVRARSDTLPGTRVWTFRLFLYAKNNSLDAVPAADLDTILDVVDDVFTPSPVTGKVSLGGTVSHCRIEGGVMLDPGDLDGQAMAIIPITVLIP